ncbi:MAG: DNA polymerase [Candidatus Hodarchaeota archaeon]
MSNFFDLGVYTAPTVKKKSTKKIIGCEKCSLKNNCYTPKMQPSGEGLKKIMIVGEAPGKTEDEEGIPFIGKSGKLLSEILEDLGINFRKDCIITNVVCCRPPNNIDPSPVEIENCKVRLLNLIQKYKPRLIFAVGLIAIKGLITYKITGRIKGTKANEYFFKAIPDLEWDCWIYPIFHPAYILRNNERVDLKKIWIDHIKKALNYLNESLPVIKENIKIIEDCQEAINFIKFIRKQSEIISIDYETTGVKPQRESHEIVTVAIGYKENNEIKATAFPLFQSSLFRVQLKKLLVSNIKKIAHKADFEYDWTKIILTYPINNIIWDTCLASHCLDSKTKTNLKFQSLINFGVIGYDEKVEKYISGVRRGEDKDSDNRFNRIKEAPLKDLLYYNALDSLYTFHLYEKQKKEFDDFTLNGYKFLLKSIITFAKIQIEGMLLNVQDLDLYWIRLTKKINKYEKLIKSFSEYKKWPGRKELNIDSSVQLNKLLYKILKYKVPLNCKDKKASEKALKSINTDFTKTIILYKKCKKLRDTYLAQFKREHINGIVYPFFNLHIAKTFRSSSNSINFQNISKRSKESFMVRDIIIPRKNCLLVEYDYKGIEVSVSACHHKDPNMIKYIIDPSTDMHRDTAADIFIKDKKKITKEERYLAKNGFVFPAFYGSTTKNIAPEIWDQLTDVMKDHLKSKGIKKLNHFYQHIYEIESVFWNERFPVYKEWKDISYNNYEKKGYVELYTGFRIYGPLDYTQVTNYPIQGSAFHILLFSLNYIFPEIKKLHPENYVIGQIHDSIVCNIHKSVEKQADEIIYKYGIKKVMESFKWINVPLSIEKEKSAESWAYMESCGVIK